MKKLKTFIITLILGALGSACWEWALKPLFIFIYNRIILHSLHLFSDSFYSSVPECIDAPVFYTYYWFMTFFALAILLPPRFIRNFFHRKPEGKADSIFLSATRFTCFVIIISTMFTKLIAYQTATHTLTAIEIIAPYISDTEYKTLKSEFYRIGSKADYTELTDQINSVMDEYNLAE